jgi:hypothetical protein
MRKTLIFVLILVISFSFLQAKKKKVKFDAELKGKIETYYSSQKIAVVMLDGLPAMTEKGEDGDQKTNHYPIVCKDGGGHKLYFKLRTFSPIQTNELQKGQLLTVEKFSVKKNGIWVMLRSKDEMELSRGKGAFERKKNEFHRTGIMFKFSPQYIETNSEENFEFIKEALSKYITFHASVAKAQVFIDSEMDTTAEIKEGMTIEEVVKILGLPKKKAKIGNKLMYKYEDMKIIFEDGKVVKVDF